MHLKIKIIQAKVPLYEHLIIFFSIETYLIKEQTDLRAHKFCILYAYLCDLLREMIYDVSKKSTPTDLTTARCSKSIIGFMRCMHKKAYFNSIMWIFNAIA